MCQFHQDLPWWCPGCKIEMIHINIFSHLSFSDVKPTPLIRSLLLFIFRSILPFLVPLDCSEKNCLRKRDHQSKYQPILYPLYVGGGGQLFEDADEEGGHSQHNGQIDSYCSVEELWPYLIIVIFGTPPYFLGL